MNKLNKEIIKLLLIVVLISSLVGGASGFAVGIIYGDSPVLQYLKNKINRNYARSGSDNGIGDRVIQKVSEESDVINTAQKSLPSVVSIVVTKELPVYENSSSSGSNQPGSDFFNNFFGGNPFFGFDSSQTQRKEIGTEKKEVGGGTGFIVSSDGYIITNKHVVTDEAAEYTAVFNDDSKHEAKVLARDIYNDIAILKIDGKNLPILPLGNSLNLKVGQSVVAIGNALGEFRNTVSTGVVSGLSRSIMAGGGEMDAENLTGVIQTDASINPGNSGGPLLNIAGQVIGINTAVSNVGQNIGFAIPINEAKNILESVKKYGKIIRPWLGVRYVQINKDIAKENKLKVEYGALIIRGDKRTDLAVVPGSPADKAGLEENDIILEVNGKEVTEKTPLQKILSEYAPNAEIELKIQTKGVEKKIKVKLEEMKN
ncbi:MAG: trypsin-like peptidase domain-containing protein [Candidatus Falkowbacteria bacterium]|nr:trypsin-like peptidase domain-containing protein [Candidatus Falkowbacteria bacterium]